MKRNHCNARSVLEPISKHSKTLFERAKLVIDFHSQRLKHLSRWMMTAMPTDQFLDGPRQR